MEERSSLDSLSQIRIVLVEPAGALNVGSVARVMKNMGLQYLVLVNPQCDPLSEESRMMAVHAGEILAAARSVKSLPEAIVGCERAIATTGRIQTAMTQLESPRSALPWLLSCSRPTALIFGPEDRGLSNEELKYAQRYVRIPSSSDYASLNLAQAVAVCGYELYTLSQSADLTPQEQEREPTASLETMESYYQQLESVLLAIGYLYPHTTESRMKKFRHLFNKAQLSAQEVTMLRGILSQVAWLKKQLDRGSSDES